MPSTKRQRQRAYRQARQARIEKTKRRRHLLQRGGVALLVVIVGVGLVYVFNGRGGGKTKLSTKPTSTTTRAHSRSPSTRRAAITTTTAKGAATPCPAPNGSSPRRTTFSQPPPACISPTGSYTATMTTDVGRITISLDARTSPTATNDFVVLARYHFYDGLPFHRVIPGFVVQGGDPNPPTAANPNPTGPQDPGYTLPGEAPKAGSYRAGSVAMAKTSSAKAGTAGSQFFILTSQHAAQQLPPDYALIGQVTSGMSVVSKIEAGGTQAGTPKVVHKIVSVTISSP